MKVKIADIKTDSGTQTRIKIDEETVTDYAEAMNDGASFPPVILFHDGSDYFMADGFHRILAASRNGKIEIDSDVMKGTRLDALTYALGANGTNGLRRSNADKHHCVEIALKEFPDWSDRKIAEICAVHHDLVGSVRSENEVAESATHKSATRTGRDGKQHPAKKGNRSKAQKAKINSDERLSQAIHCAFELLAYRRQSWLCKFVSRFDENQRAKYARQLEDLIARLKEWHSELISQTREDSVWQQKRENKEIFRSI